MNRGKIPFLGLMAFLLSGCEQPTPSQPYSFQTPRPSPPQPSHHQIQLLAIRRHGLRTKALLNPSEQRIFWNLVQWASKSEHKYRIFPQTSLGEVFQSVDQSDTGAYSAVVCKRADFLVTRSDFTPLALVEYFGPGHKGPTSADRDAIKLAAAENAGILFIVIEEGEEAQAVDIVEAAISRGASRHRIATSDSRTPE